MNTTLIDLRQWLRQGWPTPKDGLLAITLTAVDIVSWPDKTKPFGLTPADSIPQGLLMILEVYCYARGIYDSCQVAAQARQNPELAPLFKDQEPTFQLLRHFRRHCREPIRLCLEAVFDLALRVRFGQRDTEEAPVDYCVVKVLDQWFVPLCGPHPDLEARERIDQAVFWDGMEAA